MKWQILSDIHLDGGRTRRWQPPAHQLDGLLTHGAEGLIFAGDLSNDDADKIEALKIMSEAYKYVLVVLGNHDHWHKEYPPTALTFAINGIAPGRLFLLENDSVTIDGTTFHGSTLWFKKTTMLRQLDKSFADFRFIPNAYPHLYDQHEKSVAYLLKNVKPGDVVITHHTPSLKSVPDQFKDDPYTGFFSNDADWLVNSLEAKLWIHGHTHNHFDYMLGKTRILCNPVGYEGEHGVNYKPMMLDL